MDNKNRARRHADVLRAEIDGKDFRITDEKVVIRAKSKEGCYYKIGVIYFDYGNTIESLKIRAIDHYNIKVLFCYDGEVESKINKIKHDWIYENASE